MANLTGSKTVKGTAGNDLITVTGKGSGYGLGGDDQLFGSNQGNLMDGGSGNDVVFGNGGSDDLRGGSGDDYLNADESVQKVKLDGGSGDDFLRDGGGRGDFLNGGSGNDSMHSRGGDDLRGGTGNDFFALDFRGLSTASVTKVNGGADHDTIHITAPSDTATWLGSVLDVQVTGESTLTVSYAQDMEGTGRVKVIEATGTNEILFNNDDATPVAYRGGDSNNTVETGIGHDRIYLGEGDETLKTGDGNDLILFTGNTAAEGGMGKDLLMDYQGSPSEAFGQDVLHYVGAQNLITSVEHHTFAKGNSTPDFYEDDVFWTTVIARDGAGTQVHQVDILGQINVAHITHAETGIEPLTVNYYHDDFVL